MDRINVINPATDGNNTNNNDWLYLMSMANNGFGGMGGGGWLWLLFLLFCGGGFGNGLNGGNGFLSNQINNTAGRDLLMQAIAGNRDAINQLASQLNCSINQIQNAICSLNSAVQNVGNQVGMTGMQIINAVQAGNNQLASQLASCCCDLKTTSERGFSSLAFETQKQTCDLQNTINGGVQTLNSRIDAMERNALNDKLDALREKNSTLTTQLNLEHQNAVFGNMLSQGLAPINAKLSDFDIRLGKIECKQPETVNVPYSPVTAIPNCIAYQYGFNGGFPFGGIGNGFWG